MKNLTIIQKIHLKGITYDVNELIKSGYKICKIKDLHVLQIPVYIDVVPVFEGVYIHKHTIGGYYTYRSSTSKDDEFKHTDKCKFIYKCLNVKHYLKRINEIHI